jgi:hypothetical protein
MAESGGAGFLAGVRSACQSATVRALGMYSQADGHDAALLGSITLGSGMQCVLTTAMSILTY